MLKKSTKLWLRVQITCLLVHLSNLIEEVPQVHDAKPICQRFYMSLVSVEKQRITDCKVKHLTDNNIASSSLSLAGHPLVYLYV